MGKGWVWQQLYIHGERLGGAVLPVRSQDRGEGELRGVICRVCAEVEGSLNG